MEYGKGVYMTERTYKQEKRDISSYNLKQLTIRVPEDVSNALKDYCKEQKISVQQLIERYIYDTLQNR